MTYGDNYDDELSLGDWISLAVIVLCFLAAAFVMGGPK